jgi:Xaa-Pro dipeptidase
MRLTHLMAKMEQQNIKQAFLMNDRNIFYVTGLSINFQERFGGVFVHAGKVCHVFCHQMDVPHIQEQNQEMEITYWNDDDDPLEYFLSLIKLQEPLGLEKDAPAHLILRLLNKNRDAALPSISPLIEELRIIKDAQEIALLKQSASISDAILHQWVQLSYDLMSEQNAAYAIQELYALHEMYDFPFRPVVAYGSNSANPNHQPTNRYSSQPEVTLVRLGCKAEHYAAPITRTFFFGKPPDDKKAIYECIKEAQLRAIEMIKPGFPLYMIDKMARDFLNQSFFGRHFIHGVGHGVGLSVYEPPFITQENTLIIQPGMIFSIGPGVYIPGQFGMRVEDIVLVTDNGCEKISKSPMVLQAIPAYKS